MCINHNYRGGFGTHWKSLKYIERRPFFVAHYILRGGLLCELGCRQPLVCKFSLQNPVTVKFAVWTKDVLIAFRLRDKPISKHPLEVESMCTSGTTSLYGEG
jgi:hypothetical protein